MPTRVIYKIVDELAWLAAEAEDHFVGSAVDIDDGYIHFSTAEQLSETASRYFAGRRGLLLVAVDAERIAPTLKWEPSRGGALFPHLYDMLPFSAIVSVSTLPLNDKGQHVFPELEGESA